MRVRVSKPKKKVGGPSRGSYYVPDSFGYNSRLFPYYHPSSEWTQPDLDVRSSISSVPQEDATLEAEGGETAYVPDNGGLPAHYDINGPRHSEGGVPLDLPEDSFIFSDTRSMKIGGPILKFFGKGDTSKKYTPADIAKQYDINKFRKQLQDPASDPIQVKTAELMIENYNKKLGQLGLTQEAMKGFPDGIPVVALPYLASMAIDPDQVLPLRGTAGPTQDLEQNPTTGAYGGQRHLYDSYGGQFLDGGSGTWADPNYYAGGGQYTDKDLVEFAHSGHYPLDISDNDLAALKATNPNVVPYTDQSRGYWDRVFHHKMFPVEDPRFHEAARKLIPGQASGVIDYAKNLFEFPGNTLNTMMTGYYEPTGTTVSRYHQPSGARDFALNTATDPLMLAPTTDVAKGLEWAARPIAKPLGKAAVKYAAKPVSELTDIAAKQLSPELNHLRDLVTSYGYDVVMNAVDKVGKSYDSVAKYLSRIDLPALAGRYTPAIASSISKYTPQSVGIAPPIMASDRPQPIPVIKHEEFAPDTLGDAAWEAALKKKHGGSLPKAEEGFQQGQVYGPNGKVIYRSSKNSSGDTVVQFTDRSVLTIPRSSGVSNTTQQQKSSKTASNKAVALPKDTTYHSKWLDEVNKQGYDWNAPQVEDHLYTPKVQSKTKTGVYGTSDWGHGDMYQDWQNRHQWYLKDHPNFNPSNPDDVKDFQTQYNNRLTSLGLPAYFDAKRYGKPFDIDSKFGQHTWATPDPTKVKPAEQVKQEDKQTAKALELNKDTHWKSQGTYAPWWLQDVIGTAGAAGDLLRLKKYLPWAPKVSPVLPDATFVDPTRALAANAEAANIQTQGANAYGTPQQFSARSAGIQGQHAKAVADVLGQYANENVQIANRNQSERAGILNQTNQFNAKTAEDLYDKTTIANQQFDNSKNQARGVLRNNYIQAITNRAQTQAMNEMNPYYNVDPTTGGFIGWTGQKPPGFFGSGTGSSQGMSAYDQAKIYKDKDPNMTWTEAMRMAELPEDEMLKQARIAHSMYPPSSAYHRGFPMNPGMYNQGMYQGYPGYGYTP